MFIFILINSGYAFDLSSLLLTSWKPLISPCVYTGDTTISFGGGQQDYDLVVDNNGYPRVVYAESKYGNWEIHYIYWNGSVWTTFGTGNISNTDGVSRYPSIALDQDDFPYVCWVETPRDSMRFNQRYWSFSKWVEKTAPGSQIYLIRWNGTQWLPIET
ncbi:MAG: hypothetical protein QME64_07450 [bacterium]|nr:hypothetical protein [bacterium]